LGNIAPAAQAIPPIATHFSVVCLSVCRLSHSCTVLKPFDGFRCHLAGRPTRWQHYVRWGSLNPHGRGDLGSNSQPKQAIANCVRTVSPMLPPGEYKRGVCDSAFYQITLVLVVTFVIIIIVIIIILITIISDIIYFSLKEKSWVVATKTWRVLTAELTTIWSLTYVELTSRRIIVYEDKLNA